MNDKVFFDTNVLVYAFDSSDTRKQKAAFSLIEKALKTDIACISTQILCEFYVTVTRKIVHKL